MLDGAGACCGRRTGRSSVEETPVAAIAIGGEVDGGGVGGRICIGLCVGGTVGRLRACCSAKCFLWSAAVCNAEVINWFCFSSSERVEAEGLGGGACCGGEVGAAE